MYEKRKQFKVQVSHVFITFFGNYNSSNVLQFYLLVHIKSIISKASLTSCTNKVKNASFTMSVQAMIVTRKLTRSKKMKDNDDHKSRFCIVKNDKKKILDYDLSLFYTAYFEKKFTS